jgi:hypothetical protein
MGTIETFTETISNLEERTLAFSTELYAHVKRAITLLSTSLTDVSFEILTAKSMKMSCGMMRRVIW